MLKLNLGCGSDIREDYINIDKFVKHDLIYNYDIFNLPYPDTSVDEVLCSSVIEHLSFVEEKKIFDEVYRVLKRGGKFEFVVPDFMSLVMQWLQAEDDFINFYTTEEEDWFGNGSRTIENKWGYLTATIFGNQSTEGQFHKNAYTVKKINKIMRFYDYTKVDLDFHNFKDTEIKMIRCIGIK